MIRWFLLRWAGLHIQVLTRTGEAPAVGLAGQIQSAGHRFATLWYYIVLFVLHFSTFLCWTTDKHDAWNPFGPHMDRVRISFWHWVISCRPIHDLRRGCNLVSMRVSVPTSTSCDAHKKFAKKPAIPETICSFSSVPVCLLSLSYIEHVPLNMPTFLWILELDTGPSICSEQRRGANSFSLWANAVFDVAFITSHPHSSHVVMHHIPQHAFCKWCPRHFHKIPNLPTGPERLVTPDLREWSQKSGTSMAHSRACKLFSQWLLKVFWK